MPSTGDSLLFDCGECTNLCASLGNTIVLTVSGVSYCPCVPDAGGNFDSLTGTINGAFTLTLQTTGPDAGKWTFTVPNAVTDDVYSDAACTVFVTTEMADLKYVVACGPPGGLLQIEVSAIGGSNTFPVFAGSCAFAGTAMNGVTCLPSGTGIAFGGTASV